ncbi:GNAT family N-acetyltransferase [Kribbella albertanoniae]|uniref:GNAT family N-acetyltransferase n=1 Tax=Kribbella albertanoniae TaxID=1266829 RepID=A0A4R4PSQ4_9ACTN|nr:GNAT family N-acetyltransferase [Kribbella albertanoniae]TDC25372.1 GNAT family N-acetyltransferase [Kribbella albertanoniae]
MPKLTPPTATVHHSFLTAWDEFGTDDRWLGARSIVSGAPEWTRDQAADPAEFAAMVAAITSEASAGTTLAPEMLPQTVLWYVDGPEWLGRLSIRHRLGPAFAEGAGHITYGVRPSARRRGYATAMLIESLPVAAALGIDPARVTCLVDNVGSRKAIEAAGGVLQDEYEGKLRYWVATGRA